MGRTLGALAGVTAWLGWLSVCPALGFPTLATAGMLNRVFVPREDPVFWLGWALLLIGLASAVLLYLAAVDRGRLRPSIASGLAYGAICWLVVGAVVMPLLGLADPLPASPTSTDPMRGSFMMLHLGIGAPIAGLVSWLMLGAVVGATAGRRPEIRPLRQTPRALALGAAISIVMLFAIAFALARLGDTPTGPAGVVSRTLASGPVQALPEGSSFMSIIRLPQPPGSTLGPHAHFPGFAYSLNGVATMSFDDGRQVRVGSGEAGFVGSQAMHAHLNADDRVPAGALALLIVALTALVCVLASRPANRAGRLLPVALALLIGVGALGAWNPWSNDWLFFAVRPVAGRAIPMPIPTGSRVYESPDLAPLPPGPYLETLEEMTLALGEAADVESAGAAVLLVIGGRVEVRPAGGSLITIGPNGATLLQSGVSVRVANVGDRPAHVLQFAVTPAPGT